MFAEWVTTGVGWGVMIASAAFTLFVVAGVVVGFMSILAWWLKGGRVDAQDEKDFEDFNRKSNRSR